MVEFKNITKSYRNKIALDNFSFKVNQNESIGIIGNNGSGKTTLINILGNLIKYEKGEIFIFNDKLDPKTNEYKKNTGFIFSYPYYIEEFNVINYLYFVARFHSQELETKSLKKRINDLIELLGIEEKEKPISTFSEGNKRKVTIAASLIHNPKLLVYDEPFVNLDISTLEVLKKLLINLSNSKTLIITSHHIDLVIDICDKYLIIDNGKLIKTINKSSYKSMEELKNDLKGEVSKSNNENSNLNWLI
ncbi:ABC transporter ATP-binding protein [Gaetbulibacter jejuensis]|uniref:ABC transporter ATP-binding protein n=1 Tax=Gaetbulibacter jejuensis TaxID=584607 RepID=A0ABN1JGF6_9FLAO